MDVRDLLLDLYGRVPHLVEGAADGLTPEQLTWAPGEGANTIAWLVWHLSRVFDAYASELRSDDQAYPEWAPRFGLQPDPADNGYGHTAEQVLGVRPDSAQTLLAYQAVAQDRMVGYLDGLTSKDLAKVIDESWDPPVTLGVRLISIADDAIQHAGQAAYVRGLLPG